MEPEPQVESSTVEASSSTTTDPVIQQTYRTNVDSEALLPIPKGVLTRNKCGIPIIIVLTKADKLDSIGDHMVSRGLVKGKGLTSLPGTVGNHVKSESSSLATKYKEKSNGWNWDERVDWALAAIRVAGLMCEFACGILNT